MSAAGHDRLIARLEAVAELAEDERAAVRGLPFSGRILAAGEDVACDGDVMRETCVVINGYLQRHKDLRGGVRQILAFHIPGDLPDLQSLRLPLLDHTLSAVTDLTVATIPHEALQAMIDAHPRLERALWGDSLIAASMFREWIINLGGRSAFARLAHLFCELHMRSRAVGLGAPGESPMPLTQARLGEALGLSVVHVNRMLASLRREGLLELAQRRLRILDWDRLREAAEFDPAYLHLREGVVEV